MPPKPETLKEKLDDLCEFFVDVDNFRAQFGLKESYISNRALCDTNALRIMRHRVDKDLGKAERVRAFMAAYRADPPKRRAPKAALPVSVDKSEVGI